MRIEILSFIVSLAICLIGGVGLAAYALRSRSHERDLLWVGLFAVLYGADLVLRNPVFQLGFGSTHSIALLTPRILSASSIVPGMLLFEAFYGRGWRSLLRWLIIGYGVAAALVYGYMVVHHTPELIPSAGVILVICVPLVLFIGRIAGYTPPKIEHANVLFAGLLCFFITFSVDHVRNAADRYWRPGLEPYGFVILLTCLTFIATQRVLADERRLASFTQEMEAAAAIQASILPRSLPQLEQARVAVRYAPMTAVAGDFYDFPKTSPGCVDILLVDVMGHGVPAALVASMVKVAVLTQQRDANHPAQIIKALNSVLCDEAPRQYVTAEYIHLDLPEMSGVYSAAAHPPPLLWSRSRQRLTALGEGGLLLGVRKDESYSDSRFKFEPGDRLLLYTDGLTEAENSDGQPFGDAILPGFMAEHQSLDADKFAAALQDAVLSWSRSNKRVSARTDDITFLVIDLLPGRESYSRAVTAARIPKSSANQEELETHTPPLLQAEV